jgi:hypothetical protein
MDFFFSAMFRSILTYPCRLFYLVTTFLKDELTFAVEDWMAAERKAPECCDLNREGGL